VLVTAHAAHRALARVSGPLRLVAMNGFGVLLVLLAVEGFTRTVGPRFPAIGRVGPGDRGLWVYDATKGWFHAPGSTGRAFLGGPDPADVRINSLGLRGAEVARTKPPETVRVLVFGDSFVFGVGVSEEHLVTSRLERLLRTSAQAGSGRRYEVVNMGVSGFSTDQELLLFDDLGAALRPDLVVLFCVDNDFEGNVHDFAYHAYYKPHFVLQPDGSLALRNVPVPRLDRAQRIKLWLGRESNVWNAARSRGAGSGGAGALPAFFQIAVPQTTTADQIGLMHALLTVFRRRVEAAGAQLVVFNTGHRGERTPLFQALRPRLRRDGFRFLGLEGTLGEARARAGDGHWDFGRDTHWNVDAHRLVGEVVHEYLRRNGLAAGPRAAASAPVRPDG
jgi:hypothetical protein